VNHFSFTKINSFITNASQVESNHRFAFSRRADLLLSIIYL